MNTRQKFKQRVLELIHNLPYKEAILKEAPFKCSSCGSTDLYKEEDGYYNCNKCRYWTLIYIGSITLSRVMQALSANYICTGAGEIIKLYDTEYGDCINYDNTICWKLLTADKQTATDDDQTDEVIEEIYNLIK